MSAEGSHCPRQLSRTCDPSPPWQTLSCRIIWREGQRRFALSDRKDCVRVYEIVLTEGLPDDIAAFVNGNLLVDLWGDLYLREDNRRAWQPLIDKALGGRTL